MIPPRTLSSLPSDVLLEILSHLLVDTSPESNRASVLRTRSLLYELGLPLLYRVVELRGFSTRALVLEHWRRLFGEGGLLIEGGRKEELARNVKEIRLGGEANFPPQDYYGDKDKVMEKVSASSLVQKVTLPSCSRLVVNLWNYCGIFKALLRPLISQLPITHLQIQHNPYPFLPQKEFDSVSFLSFTTLSSILFGPSSSSYPWTELTTVVFQEFGWRELVEQPSPGPRPLFLQDWSFKLLVFEVTSHHPSINAVQVASYLFPRSTVGRSFFDDTERIELRLYGAGAGEFEKELRKRVAERAEKGLDASHKRVLDLVAFVDEDGKERKLI